MNSISETYRKKKMYPRKKSKLKIFSKNLKMKDFKITRLPARMPSLKRFQIKTNSKTLKNIKLKQINKTNLIKKMNKQINKTKKRPKKTPILKNFKKKPKKSFPTKLLSLKNYFYKNIYNFPQNKA